MSLNVIADSPGRDPRSRPSVTLRAEVGDSLIAEGAGVAGIQRIGEIVAVAGADGSPPYRLRRLAGDYESLVFSAGPCVEKVTDLPSERGKRSGC